MAIASRRAETVWNGTLAAGQGAVRGDSGAIDALPVTWAARTQAPEGKTSPEELAAAAHSTCFAMALALRLGEHKARVERMTVAATVTLDEVDGVPTSTRNCDDGHGTREARRGSGSTGRYRPPSGARVVRPSMSLASGRFRPAIHRRRGHGRFPVGGRPGAR